MTTEELRTIADQIDSKNAQYIVKNESILNKARRIDYWRARTEPRARVIADDITEQLYEEIREFDKLHLTPANAKVGDGATVKLYTDRHAGTIVKVTKATITIRRDKAILSPDFKPQYVAGGFAAHCVNQDEQEWTYEPDENGELTTLYWSNVYNQYGRPGDLIAIKGRHEYYDYNF